MGETLLVSLRLLSLFNWRVAGDVAFRPTNRTCRTGERNRYRQLENKDGHVDVCTVGITPSGRTFIHRMSSFAFLASRGFSRLKRHRPTSSINKASPPFVCEIWRKKKGAASLSKGCGETLKILAICSLQLASWREQRTILYHRREGKSVASEVHRDLLNAVVGR